MCDVYEEAYFTYKDVYKWAEYGFATLSLSWKDSWWSENTLTLQQRKSSWHSSQ